MQNRIKAILGILILSILAVSAQQRDTISVKGVSHTDYLPKAGNFGVGTLATPLFNYIGNMLSAAGTNSLDMSIPAVILKYYLTDNTALRAEIQIDKGSTKTMVYSRDDAAFLTNPLGNAQVTDSKVYYHNYAGITIAYQKFIGLKRLRGFYGIQGICVSSNPKDVYSYGNPMSVANPTPTTNLPGAYLGNERILMSNTAYSPSFQLGVGGIAGFEYYVLPRLCIGGEVSLNFIYVLNNQTYQKTEKYVGAQYQEIDKAITPAYSESKVETLSFTPVDTPQQLGLYVVLHF